MNGVNYLLQTNLYLMLFMGFYILVLRNETFFRQNRIYLNTSIFLSFGIPFMNADWFRDLFITQRVRESAIIPSQQMYETIIVDGGGSSSWSAADIVLGVYIAGALIFLIRFFIRLAVLRSTLKPAKGSAFSFFNILVVDRDLPEAATIIDHEKVHMRQMHSADIILIELAAVVNWFNPVMYLYKKEIRHIHEFIADEEAASMMPSKSDYALLLFSNTLGIHPSQLSNSFFNKSLLKRRIVMLNKNKSRSTGLWKYGFSAPLFVLMLIVSASTASSEHNVLGLNSEKPISLLTQNPPLAVTNRATGDKTVETSGTANRISDSEPKTSSAPAADFDPLYKHIQRNIKYPASAREANVSGYVMVNFAVKNKTITNLAIATSLNKDVDNEALRTLSLFKEPIEAADNKYSVAILFNLVPEGTRHSTFKLPDISSGHIFAGQIVVTAYKAPIKKSEITIIPKETSSDESSKEFVTLETQPEFAGGMRAWGEYLRANLKYPAQARTDSTQGRVILSFIVEKDGSLSEIKVLRGVGGGLDEEAVRVLTASPNWKPGIQNGRPVRVAYTMPIVFRLQSKPAEQKPATESTN